MPVPRDVHPRVEHGAEHGAVRGAGAVSAASSCSAASSATNDPTYPNDRIGPWNPVSFGFRLRTIGALSPVAASRRFPPLCAAREVQRVSG